MPEPDTTPAAALCDRCDHAADEHSIYGCLDECGCPARPDLDRGTSGRTETGGTIATAHPSVLRWRVEHVDGDEWVPASGMKTDRAEAVHLLNVGNKSRPLWADGTPVQRRLVRETTSYTVETALAPPVDQGRGGQ